MSTEPHDPPDETGRRWRMPFTWLGLIAVTWAVYELTHSPALACVLICLKFGWDEFRTAAWLYRRDPHRWRREATFALYVAWGLWKAAGVAFLMAAAFALLTPANAVPQAVRLQLIAFLHTALTSLACFGLSTVMTALAAGFAWYGGARLWLGGAAHRARRFDFWPPTPFCIDRRNRLSTLLLTALGVGFTAAIVGLLLVVPPGPGGTCVGFALSISAPVLLVLCREVLSTKLRAETPEECWPEEWDPQQEWRDPPAIR